MASIRDLSKKYAPLVAFLAEGKAEEVVLNLLEIETLIGEPVEQAGRTEATYWTDERRAHVRALHEAGWDAQLDRQQPAIIFVRREQTQEKEPERALDADDWILRARYKQEIYGTYAPAFNADHWILIDEPYKALTIPKRLPTHLHPEVAYESVRVWAAQAFGAFADEWPLAQWSADGHAFERMVWPFPVGKKALCSEVERQNLIAKDLGLPPVHSRLLPAMMPLDGDEYAFLILRIPVRTSHVTMFGLAKPVDDGDGRVFRLSDCRFLLSSATPYDAKKDSDAARMRMVIGHARRFFDKFKGVKHRGSMNAGRSRLPAVIEDAQWQILQVVRDYRSQRGCSWEDAAVAKGENVVHIRYLRNKFAARLRQN